MTPTDMIRFILRNAGVNGVGQAPSSEDNNDMLTHLNLLLGQWSAQRTMVYHLVDTAIPVTGAQSYTVGSGGNFNIIRPNLIDAALYRRTDVTPNLDYKLSNILTREEYDSIVVKNVGTWPSRYFYDSGYPLGSVYFWPIPTTGTLVISTKGVLSSFPDLVTDIALPPEYLNAILWNGAEMARVLYQLPPDQSVTRRAAGALSVIRASNFQVPQLTMPYGIPQRGYRYNVYSDQGGVG